MTTDEFRTEVRAWLSENCPVTMRTPAPEDEIVWGGGRERFKNPDSKIWLERMISRGWTVPTWSTEYGGAGLTRDESLVLRQELRAINARPALMSFGISMLGPAMLEFASEKQKLYHLPRMARGEVRWCQGYSEPAAGSDLASLKTSAEDCGDHFLVKGSKIWTSNANLSDWIFALVRTDRTAPKHRGISFLLIDLASNGVATSPIELISGASVFCQVFFDNVCVPKENLVGPLNGGWPIAKRLLHHERNMVSSIGGTTELGGKGRRLPDVAKQYSGEAGGKIADVILRDQIAQHTMDDRAFQLTLLRAAHQAKAGEGDPDWASMFKYYGTEQNQRKYELMLDCMGIKALGWEGDSFQQKELKTTRQWLRSKANTIEGGTSEIQLNIIAKRILQLPD